MDEPSGGKPALVRNAGWRRATGRYIHFLDDDDLVVDGAYAALAGALDANARAGVAFGGVEPFGDDPAYLRHNQALFADSARRARASQRLRSRRYLLANMMFCNPCLTCSACMIRREGVVALGGFDPDTCPYEDADFYIRAIRRFGQVFVDRVVLRYRTGHSSLMTAVPASRGPEAYRTIYRKYREENGSLEFMALKLMGRVFLR
jgi:glycosyltransferase involved in cell wall biosynthesis